MQMQIPTHKNRARQTNHVRRAGNGSRRKRLTFEPLEQRAMLAVVLGAPPADCQVQLPADIEPLIAEPAIIEETPLTFEDATTDGDPAGEVALPEGWSLQLVNPWVDFDYSVTLPEDGSDPALSGPTDEFSETGEWSTWSDEGVNEGIVSLPDGGEPVPGDDQLFDLDRPDDRVRCGTDQIHAALCRRILEEYRDFVTQNPTWPEEHGAGGIQLTVMTPSKYLPQIKLSTPGEARSFDAWWEQRTLVRNEAIAPIPAIDDVPAAVEDGAFVDSEPSLEGVEPVLVVFPGVPTPVEPIDLPKPVAAPTDGSDVSAYAGTSALPLSEAVWAVLGSTQAGAEATAVTPVGGRRRSR
jgi:hypothetical protein